MKQITYQPERFDAFRIMQNGHIEIYAIEIDIVEHFDCIWKKWNCANCITTTRRLQNISDGNFLTIVFCPKRMHPKNYSNSLKIFQLKIDSQQKAQVQCTDSKSNTIWSNKPLFNWLIPRYDRLYNWIIFNDHHF